MVQTTMNLDTVLLNKKEKHKGEKGELNTDEEKEKGK